MSTFLFSYLLNGVCVCFEASQLWVTEQISNYKCTVIMFILPILSIYLQSSSFQDTFWSKISINFPLFSPYCQSIGIFLIFSIMHICIFLYIQTAWYIKSFSEPTYPVTNWKYYIKNKTCCTAVKYQIMYFMSSTELLQIVLYYADICGYLSFFSTNSFSPQ